MHHDRLFTTYPRMISGLMEDLYRSNGTPKERILKLARRAVAGRTVPIRRMLADLIEAGRGWV
jgi:electron transfer flavoprotein-quinone oxidoreductase